MLIQIPRKVHNTNFAKLKNTAPRTEGASINKKQSSYTSEPSRTSTTALGHVLPLKFWLLNKRFQIYTRHIKDNRNSAELIRTNPNTDGQQRKRTKQIQKLSLVNFLLENCSGKSIFDKVQLSTGAMPKSSVTFPSTNGRKMQETRTMSILPFSN